MTVAGIDGVLSIGAFRDGIWVGTIIFVIKKQMTFSPFRGSALLACLFSAFVAAAQKTNFGIYAGPSFTKLRLEAKGALPIDVNIDPYDFKTGFTVGGYYTWNFANNIGLRSEFNFERKGGKNGLQLSDGNGNPLPDYTIRENFDYLQIPLLFQLTAGDDFKMLIHIGYSFGYLLHNTDKFPDEIRVVTSTQTILLLMPESYKKYDHSLVAGIGASSTTASGMQVSVSLRAYNGKTNISKGESAFDARNISVALVAGLGF